MEPRLREGRHSLPKSGLKDRPSSWSCLLSVFGFLQTLFKEEIAFFPNFGSAVNWLEPVSCRHRFDEKARTFVCPELKDHHP